MSRELADHLKYYAEIGVDGVSRDPEWRVRAVNPPEGGHHRPETDRISSPLVSGTPVVSGFLGAEALAKAAGRIDTDTLETIQADIGADCRRCKLCTLGRSQIVFGVGHPKARLMFVGEAPGEEEDRRGEPFVGRAGQLLTKIIEAIGLTRDQVYIANVIKCRPPGNRNPEPDEVGQCEPFLFRQIDAIQPRVIVPLGKFAAQSLLKTTDPITRLRGRRFEYRGAALIPTFHPAYLLRNPSAKREVWEDMKKVRAMLQSDS
jgi:DNA polymerase